jgi:hypothetical protein
VTDELARCDAFAPLFTQISLAVTPADFTSFAQNITLVVAFVVAFCLIIISFQNPG